MRKELSGSWRYPKVSATFTEENEEVRKGVEVEKRVPEGR